MKMKLLILGLVGALNAFASADPYCGQITTLAAYANGSIVVLIKDAPESMEHLYTLKSSSHIALAITAQANNQVICVALDDTNIPSIVYLPLKP